MAYTVHIDRSGPWLVTDFAGVVMGDDLVSSRQEAAVLNADGGLADFILDFTSVTEFVLTPESVARIQDVDQARAGVVTSGRCAIVTPRELVTIGTTFLAAISPLNLDFRTFGGRAQAEAWLRGELLDAPPTLPRRK